jgi:hypothetical protein
MQYPNNPLKSSLTTLFETYAVSSAGIEGGKLMPKYVCQ